MSIERETSLGEHSTFSALLDGLAHFSDRPLREDPPFQVGELLLERYVLQREIGRGGMGFVYEAIDREHDARCALKTLRKLGAESIVVLKNEFRAIARIHHANLVRPGELREHGAHWFYTMELVDGHHPLSWTAGNPERIRMVLLALADVLATIHAHGVVHRDVKPANVITNDQRTVLLDLGLARDMYRRSSFDREEHGTRRYMAPELSAGGRASPASDMYSLGVLLQELGGSEIATLDEITRQLLSLDPALRPTAAQLLARLGGGPIEIGSPSTTFVGRTIELERLQNAYDRMNDGSCATMFVHGGSGLGKTSLVEQFVARHPDAFVLSGRCYELENVPFKAIDDIVDAIRALLAERRIEPLAVECAAEPLRAALEALARIAPVIIVVDDLQWIDGDGLRLLASLLALEPPRCLLVATTRSRERPEALGTIANAYSIQLQPLSAEDSAELARSITIGLDEQEMSRIVEAARGQPYIINELVRGETALASLTHDVRRVLELVAVAGVPLPARVIAFAANVSLEVLDESLRELAMRRLVKWRGVGPAATIEPFHDRVRENLNREMSPANLVATHGSLADALLAVMPDAHASLASHSMRADRRGEAVAHAFHAATRAREGGAFAHAADLYALALECGVDDPQAIHERHAEMRVLAWQPLAAANAFRAAAALAPRERARSLEVRAIEQRLIGGDLSNGLDDLGDVLRSAGVRVPRRRWSALATMLIRRAELRLHRFRRGLRLRRDHLTVDETDLLGWASTAVMMIDAPLALGYHTRSLLAILELDDPSRLARSLATEACIQAATASLSEADRLIAEAERIAGEHESVQLALRAPRMVLGVQHGHWREVLAIGSGAAPHHTAWHNASRELYLAHCEFNLGRFADLERRCDRNLRSAGERGDRWLELVLSVSFAPMVALVHNDPDRARTIIDRGRELLWRGGHGGYLHALSACASRFVDLYTGDHARALAAWVGPGSDAIARKSHYGRVYLEFLGATAALGAMRERPTRALRNHVERAIRHLTRDAVPWARPYAAILAAQLDPTSRATNLAQAKSELARFEIGHMVDVVDRVVNVASADARLRERGVVRPDRFAAMFAPLISTT